jgi:N-acetyl-1-D-myo-inositol-2-amino-2-deoxy-alpha-D-glucopyranoside deacetylase/mycothiol S-conjugate amidase
MGTADAEHMQGFASAADMRWAELTAAARELGLAGTHHLGFRDSGMAGSDSNQHPDALSGQPVPVVAARIAHFIRLIKPQVIITHDTIGGYRHPDHIIVNKAVLYFWEHMHEPGAFPSPGGLPDFHPQKLYYPVFNRRFFKIAVKLMPLLGRDPSKVGRNKDINLRDFIDVEFPIHTWIDTRGAPAEARHRASAAHKSQLAGGPPRRGPLRIVMRLVGFGRTRDSFMRVYPAVAPGERIKESDLFEGVK